MGAHPSHFGQAFRIHEEIQTMISASARSGAPIDLRRALASLTTAFPDARRAPEAVEHALRSAAAEAYVPVEVTSAAADERAAAAPRSLRAA